VEVPKGKGGRGKGGLASDVAFEDGNDGADVGLFEEMGNGTSEGKKRGEFKIFGTK